MEKTSFTITREKHLDHLVRVVPLIVLGFALQCYILGNMSGGESGGFILFLGGALSAMIATFITYDVQHRAQLFEDRIEVHFFFSHKTVYFKDITQIEVKDPDQSFSTVTLHHGKNKIRLYFVDDAPKVKNWIEATQSTTARAA